MKTADQINSPRLDGEAIKEWQDMARDLYRVMQRSRRELRKRYARQRYENLCDKYGLDYE